LLLKAGADPSRTCSNGDTPLMVAASYGQLEVLQLVLVVDTNRTAVDTNILSHIIGTPRPYTRHFSVMTGTNCDRSRLSLTVR
jgi:hypothetical protein